MEGNKTDCTLCGSYIPGVPSPECFRCEVLKKVIAENGGCKTKEEFQKKDKTTLDKLTDV